MKKKNEIRDITELLVNAQELHKQEPEFKVPSQDELDEIRPEDKVKVNAQGERFWIEITGVGIIKLIGKIRNNPITIRGLKFDDEVSFIKENVYDIYEPF